MTIHIRNQDFLDLKDMEGMIHLLFLNMEMDVISEEQIAIS